MAKVGRALLALAWLAATAPAAGAQQLFGRIEAGTLNPDDPFIAILAFGAAAGIGAGRHDAFVLRALRQSRDRNSGPDVGHGRTFVLGEWEHAFGASGPLERQPFVRVGAGWLFRSPFESTWAVDLSAGLKYRMIGRLFLVGAATDLLAGLPSQSITSCSSPGVCAQVSITGELQNNFGLLVGAEWRF